MRNIFDDGISMGHPMKVVDVGGGFPGINSDRISLSQIAPYINAALEKHFPDSENYEFIAEPGRYFATTPFFAAAKIFATVKVSAQRVTEKAELSEYTNVSWLHKNFDDSTREIFCYGLLHAVICVVFLCGLNDHVKQVLPLIVAGVEASIAMFPAFWSLHSSKDDDRIYFLVIFGGIVIVNVVVLFIKGRKLQKRLFFIILFLLGSMVWRKRVLSNVKADCYLRPAVTGAFVIAYTLIAVWEVYLAQTNQNLNDLQAVVVQGAMQAAPAPPIQDEPAPAIQDNNLQLAEAPANEGDELAPIDTTKILESKGIKMQQKLSQTLLLVDPTTIAEDFYNVQPTPGIVVKFKKAQLQFLNNDDQIFFLNIAHCIEVPAPEYVVEDEAKLEAHMKVKDTPFEIPLSLGKMDSVKDKSGKDSFKFDIAINSDYSHEKFSKSKFHEQATIAAAISKIEDTHQVRITRSSQIILQNKKVFGALESHKIPKPPEKPIISTEQQRKRIIDLTDSKDPFNSHQHENVSIWIENGTHLKATIRINQNIKAPLLELQASIDHIVLFIRGEKRVADFFVPVDLDVTTIQAKIVDHDEKSNETTLEICGNFSLVGQE